MSLKLAVLASLLAASAAQILYLGVGEVCQDGAEKWYCRKDADCPHIKDHITNGWGPRICSFTGGKPVVCCPPESGGSSAQRPPTPRPPSTQPTWPSWTRQTRPTTNQWPSWTRPSEATTGTQDRESRPPTSGGNPRPTKDPGNAVSETLQTSKSEEMCKKYGRYVYKKVKPLSLVPGDDEEEREEAFCGRIITPLIVKGEDARPREFPHMARIGYGNKPRIDWQCGGSLISERFVLSAAHCTKPGGRLASWANLGDLDTSTEGDDAQPITLKIIERINHPDYRGGKSKPLYHDIALYKLERDIPLGIYIRPICLNVESNLRNPTAVASGWGQTFWGLLGTSSPLLQKVELKIVPNGRCNVSYSPHIGPNKELPSGINSDYMMCAGGHDGKDTCQGDSGGPLQIARREPYCTYSLIGITSFGIACGTKNPGVYTNVAFYVPWIESIVWSM